MNEYIVLYRKNNRKAVRLVTAREEHHAMAKVLARVTLKPGETARVLSCIRVEVVS